MNTIIISHESDVDGIFSASIALMRFPQSKILFTSYGKENFTRIAELLYREVVFVQGKGTVIFTDLGLNDDTLPLVLEILEFLKSNSWSMLWLDHHPWSEPVIKTLTQDKSFNLIHDKTGKYCAAEIVYHHFLLDNSTAKQLAKIAHTTDFFLKDQEIPPLPELITFYKTFPDFYSRLVHLTEKIAKGILWDVEMQKEYITYIKFSKEAKEYSLSHTRLSTIQDNLKLAFVPVSEYIQVSLFSEEVFQKTRADAAFLYNKDGKVSIRRNNDKIGCNKIAKLLVEGGGHEYAAGGKVRSNPENVDEIIEELKNATEYSLNHKNS